MAQYMLEAGESERHSHDETTTTTLLEGVAQIVMDGARHDLVRGQAVVVPPNILHTVTNTGNDRALVVCRCG